MALVTVQRSPSPNASAELDETDGLEASESSLKSPRQRRRSRSALKKLRKLFNTVRFVTKLKPCFSENYFTVKGAALILPQSDFDAAYNRKPTKQHGGDEIQSHLQAMFSLLRPQDTIKVAVKLEGNHTRYLAVVSCIGRQDTEESVILGIDLLEKAEIGLIIPLWAHTLLKLDGDGGFSITADNNIHCFKPVSVQAMWSALQSLNKVVTIATDKLYLSRGLTHTWVGYYQAKLTSNAVIISEWNKTSDIDNSYRDRSSTHSAEKSLKSEGSAHEEMTSEESFYKTIKTELKNVMMSVDLEEVTCLFLRKSVEKRMGMDLKDHRSFIDKEMMAILGQMDAPSMIEDHLYLGSEWNASNLEELQNNGVNYILNISREIDNFFPGVLHYYNVREWDVDESNLQKYWDDTYKFIEKAKLRGSKTLVHCKMGISRSASTVIAFLMKENRWSLQEAYDYCKAKRGIINPNAGFWKQLEEYEGILRANWNRVKFHNDQPALTSPDEKEEDAVGVAQYFQSPEEFLNMKFGPGSEGGEGFIHTEQDIDIASRSADSTEDSVPDNLSPEATKPKRGSNRRRLNKNISESADFGDGFSSDSSDSTDSENLSLSDYEDEDEERRRAFKQIQAPGVEIDAPSDEEGKKHGKTKSKRSKSESDKSSVVSVDDNMSLKVDGNRGQAFSREGSQTRIKPDQSWIKPEEEEGEGSAEKDPNEEETKDHSIVEDNEKSAETEHVKNVEGKSHVEEDMDVGDEANQTLVEPTAEQKEASTDPYLKENIPWNPGTVKKTKHDIEGKFGDEKKGADKVPMASNEEGEVLEIKPEIKVDLAGDAVEPMTCDVTENTEDSPMDTSENKRDMERSKDSLYAREEIDLPEGIVRKTTQEIEERNKLFAETPKKKIQRSSSMKSLRVTPKARDRDNERRRTIAILSPTSQSQPSSPTFDTFKDFETSIHDMELADLTLTDLGAAEALSCQACGDTEGEGKLSATTVKVYKYSGEELTVQEGMVRKQKMDIEHNVWRPSISEDDQTSQEQIPVPGSPNVNVKETGPPCLIGSDSPDNGTNSSVPHADIDSKEEDCMCSSVDSAPIQKVNVIKATYGDKSGENKSSTNAQTVGRKQTLSKQESRFDPEFLELIREIGSAILNSPAKPDMEQEDESSIQGKGLVSHFVKQIEASSGIQKKKARREIIVIDKDDEPCKGSRSKTREQTSGIYGLPCSSETSEKVKTKSQNDPVNKRHIYSKSKPSETAAALSDSAVETESASAKWSPVFRTSSTKGDKISPSMLDDIQRMNSVDLSRGHGPVQSESKADSLQKDSNSDVSSVRNLVGKFEYSDSSSGKSTPVFGMSTVTSPCSTPQFFPGARMEVDMSDSQKGSPPAARSTDSGSEASGSHSATQKSSVLQHRRSEPVIKLSEKSLNLFNEKLAECKAGIDQDALSEENESGDSFASEGDSVVRPKSAGQSQRRGRRTDTRRSTLRSSNTLPESQTETGQFTWEGKKVRKLYGRTHPLAKLEDQTYMESLRSNPFYNTM